MIGGFSMRFLYFELRNYAGIYNGMGLETIKIDFSKCRNVITLISGKNGVGKSTLLGAMNPLPDGTECFVEGQSAHKAMTIQDEDNIFEIHIRSDVNSNMVRQTNKAYIKKNGVELNPTGNVGSYKDIIFNEFELDANYVTLSKLSNEDRGLAMRTPSERKKFIASILNTIEVYNDINKALVKKVNIFKSYINNLDGKIKNIGDPTALYSALSSVEKRIKKLQKDKESSIAQRAEAMSFISTVDPNGQIQEEYQVIYNSIKEINSEIEKLPDVEEGTTIESLDEEYKEISKVLTKMQTKYDNLEEQKNKAISKKIDLENELDLESKKFENLKDGFEIENLKMSLEMLENSVNSLERKFNDAQIAYQTISRDEFVTIIDILKNIRENLQTIYSYNDEATILVACDAISDNKDLIAEKNKEVKENEEITNNIAELNGELEDIIKRLERVKQLDKRPKGCKIDNCPFLGDMIDTKNNMKKYEASVNKIQAEIQLQRNNKEANNIKINLYENAYQVFMQLKSVFNSLEGNKKLIKKFKTVSFFCDRNEMITRIRNMNPFNEIDELLTYVDLFNEAEDLKSMNNRLITLRADYKVALARQETIDLAEASLFKISKKISDLADDIRQIQSDMEVIRGQLTYQSENLIGISMIKENLERRKDLENKKAELKAKYEQIKGNISQIKMYLDKVNNIDGVINNIDQELPALEKERDQLNYASTNLATYTSELDLYKQKYNTVNTLKKYSSPTTGIQTLYMDMYMGKTLTMANELLGMMFEGEYQLLPYVVNESEFRIPFVGNGMPVDDISSGSTSQLCIIGTIMNLVLLYQASSRYNIVSLDEVDGGLDSHNRYDFIPTLYKLIAILGINQLIMISHNVEADMSNVDVIRLKGYETDGIDSSANIIYDYRNEK